MLSVLETLKGTLFLWLRNFRYLAAIALIGEPSDLFFERIDIHSRASSSGWASLIGLIASTGQLCFDFVGLAAVLGLLKKEPSESAYKAAWCGIKCYTCTSLRLLFFIMIIYTPSVVIVGMMVGFIEGLDSAKTYDSAMVDTVLRLTSYLSFFISAMAFPLIAVEKTKAVDALKSSWQMTRRHFLYVAGCYLFPFLVEWSVRWITASPLRRTDHDFSWAGMPMKIILDITGTAWIVLIWSMCIRIKAVDPQSLSEIAPALSQPDSPSASQTA